MNTATGLSRTVQSNSAGNYVVLNLPVGVYNITTTMQGFKKSVITAVNVDVGSKPSVDVALSVGQVGESVEVKADNNLIQTTTAEIGGVITSQEATQIQLNGRNYVQLLTLQPGVSQTVASGFQIFGTYGVNGNSQSVNGIRTDSANFFIDGVDNKDNGGGGNNFVNISPDSLNQFRDVGSTYDASYGGTSGATVSVAIKSGGRDFHGNAYEYIRNRAIQAYQFRPIGVVLPKNPLVYNDFGYTLGGPIFIPKLFNTNRDKLFFFVGQEFKRLRTTSPATFSAPNTAQLATALAGVTTPTGRGLASTLLTSPNGTFGYSQPGNNNQSEYVIKIDYNLNEKNQITGHFVHDNVLNVGNPTNYVVYDRTIPGLTSSIGWTHTFDAKTVNNAVFSFSGNKISEGGNIRLNPAFGKSIQRADYGLTYPTLYNASTIIPQITLSGFGNPNTSPRNFDNSQRIYALKDDISRVLGNHSIKAGGYFWRARKNQTAPPQLNGAFTFASLPGVTVPTLAAGASTIACPVATPGAAAGSQTSLSACQQQVSLDALAQGAYSSYSEGSNTPQVQARFTQFETYLQDDWTVSHRLTLNLGLRWQFMQPISSWPNNTSNFQPNFYDPTKAATVNRTTGLITSAPAPYNGIVLPGTGFSDKAKQVVSPTVYNNPAVLALFHNLPAGFVHNVYNTFAPRAGFAWDATGTQKIVVRGGVGVSYERVEGNYLYNAVSQVPFTAVANLSSAGNADNLGGGTASAAPQGLSNTEDPNLTPPRILNYSLGVQQRLTNSTVIEMNYVGSHSGNLTWVKNLNQGPTGIEYAAGNAGVQRNALRPYLGYGEILQYTNGATSNYNSLQARLQSRFRRGGLITLSYTWSKALSEGSAFNYQPQDSTNLHADYGPASFNQPKIFVASYVLPLPWQTNQDRFYKKIVGGWQVSGLTRIANGLPINVTDASGISPAGNLVTTAAVAQRPNLIGNPYLRNGKQYLDPAAFVTAPNGTYGNLQYDGIKGPLYDNWDAALQKNIPIHEAIGAEFRAEMFNVPNHPSFFGVGSTLGSSNFGQITSFTDPRTLEFTLRVHF